MTYKLMIVDDEKANLRLLERLFSSDYECLTASSGAEAIQLLQRHDVAILITDQRMPQMTGIELLKQTAELRPHMVRILLTGYTDVDALVEAINSGLVYMYVTKPWNNNDLKVRISRALVHYEGNKKRHALEHANERLTLRLDQMKLGFVSAFGEALRLKDEFSYRQACRVNSYAAAIGEKLTVRDGDAEELSVASLLHNVGHLGTPDEILMKSDQLTKEEVAIVEAHPERGVQILAAIAELEDVAAVVRSHRENFDGTGSPNGLGGEQISLSSRIVRVAYEYDLLTHPREVARSRSHDAALENLLGRAGTELDPGIVRALVELLPNTHSGGASLQAQ